MHEHVTLLAPDARPTGSRGTASLPADLLGRCWFASWADPDGIFRGFPPA